MTPTERMRAWRKNNPEKAREAGRRWYNNNKEKARAIGRASYERRPGSLRSKQWRDRGLKDFSYKDFLLLLERQQRRCALCGDWIDEKAHLDHDHKTLNVRGILCRDCNIGLGLFRDNKDRLELAITYLRNSRGEQRATSG